jgi:two-component system sensor kinase
LSAGAVLGKEFDLRFAVELCGADPEAAATGLAEAVRRRILWMDEAAGRGRFLHDKLREALLHRLDVPYLRELQLQTALRIEAVDADRIFELAFHFDAAACPERALPYALRAAETARRQHSLEVAGVHYRMAEPVAADDATRACVAEGLGDVRALQGSYDEAAAHLEEALGLATTGIERATLEGKLGDVAFKRGDQRSARTHLERAVRQLGCRLPHRPLGLVVALVVEVVVQIAHSLAPRLFLARRSSQGAERELLIIRLYSRLAYVYWFSAGKVPCAWAHLRGMNLAERYPPGAELAQAYSEHAPVMTMAPWFGRGIAYAQRSLAIRRTLGDVWGQGQSLHFYGVVLYAASRYRECIEKCEEAVKLLNQTGDRWEVNTATWHIAFSHYRLGELAEAVEVAKSLHAAALDIGDDTAAGISLSAWSRASGGKVPAGIVAAQLHQANDDAHTAAEVHVAEGVRLLAEGSAPEAVAVFEDAVGIVRRAGLRQEYVAPVLPWLATALRTHAEALTPYDSRHRRAVLRRARRAARRAGWMARCYRNNQPHALREQGLVAALDGRARRAPRLLSRSLATADRQGARYEHALSRLAWSSLGLGVGTATAAEVGEDAAADIAAMMPATVESGDDPKVAATLSLADRFTSLLKVGRRIASASSSTVIHAAVREAAVTLLRGKQCHVIEVGEAGTLAGTTTSGENVDQFSHSLILQALDSGTPVVLADNSTAHSADSIVLSELRSALCAPIFCKGSQWPVST